MDAADRDIASSEEAANVSDESKLEIETTTGSSILAEYAPMHGCYKNPFIYHNTSQTAVHEYYGEQMTSDGCINKSCCMCDPIHMTCATQDSVDGEHDRAIETAAAFDGVYQYHIPDAAVTSSDTFTHNSCQFAVRQVDMKGLWQQTTQERHTSDDSTNQRHNNNTSSLVPIRFTKVAGRATCLTIPDTSSEQSLRHQLLISAATVNALCHARIIADEFSTASVDDAERASTRHVNSLLYTVTQTKKSDDSLDTKNHIHNTNIMQDDAHDENESVCKSRNNYAGQAINQSRAHGTYRSNVDGTCTSSLDAFDPSKPEWRHRQKCTHELREATAEFRINPPFMTRRCHSCPLREQIENVHLIRNDENN